MTEPPWRGGLPRRRSVGFALSLCVASAFLIAADPALHAASESRLLYVGSPGILDQVEYGGVGVLVFDIANEHRFVRRIPTWPQDGRPVEKVKGLVANAKTARLYISTQRRVACFDLLTDAKVWEKEYEGGADRLALTPDGTALYVPSFKGPHWHVVDAATGQVVEKIDPNAGAHNTIVSLDGAFAYLAGLKSPWLSVVDTRSRAIVKRVGPFGDVIRPFTVNGEHSLSFVNVNGLLGFEIADLNTGKVLHRVEISGFAQGPPKRHDCPSHGIGLTPDETELWVCDGFNERIHIFDATVMPPKQAASIRLRDQPGWITFSIDGRLAYPSTGEVIDVKTKRLVTVLTDEAGRPVQSEKILEIDWVAGKPIRVGDQFGLGRKRAH